MAEAEPPAPVEEASVEEVDLSAEWANLSQITPEAAAPAAEPPAPAEAKPGEEVLELPLEETPEETPEWME